MLMFRLSAFYSIIVSFISGGQKYSFYYGGLFMLLLSFLLIRVPYIYGVSWFVLYLFVIIWSFFLSLAFSRLASPNLFFSSFVPQGTPLVIAPFVCLVEALSYLLRPIVLVIRPFVNLTLGVAGGYALGLMCFSNSWVTFFFFILFFYEVFVALVHWFIVCEILSFSENH